jgi:hypothetical protein
MHRDLQEIFNKVAKMCKDYVQLSSLVIARNFANLHTLQSSNDLWSI